MAEENLPVEPKVEHGHPPPLKWIMVTHTGHEVVMVRLIHFNFSRLYTNQAVHGESVDSKVNRELIHQISRDWIALREYIKHIPLEIVHPDEISGDDGMSLWISIPSPNSRWFKTKKRIWNTIINKWPQFLDEEWVEMNPINSTKGIVSTNLERKTTGARPWQILIHENPPEPLPIYKTPIDVVTYRQGEITEIYFNLPQGETALPQPLLKIAAAIALDMAKDIHPEYLSRNFSNNDLFDFNFHATVSDVIDELVEYYSAHPYVRDVKIINKALRIFRGTPYQFNNEIHLYHAAYSLADNQPWRTIFNCMITLAAAWRRTPIIELVGSRRYYLNTVYWWPIAEEEQFLDNLNYWIGVWWQEVLDTLAFIGPSSWNRYAK